MSSDQQVDGKSAVGGIFSKPGQGRGSEAKVGRHARQSHAPLAEHSSRPRGAAQTEQMLAGQFAPIASAERCTAHSSHHGQCISCTGVVAAAAE